MQGITDKVCRCQSEHDVNRFFDTFVVFDMFEGAKNPHQCNFRVDTMIRNRIGDYVSHSTTAYRVDEGILAATVVVFKRKTPVRQVGWTSPLLNEMPKRKLPDTTLTVTYMLYFRPPMYQEAKESLAPSFQIAGGPILTMGTKLFKFKELNFPLTKALYGVPPDVAKYSVQTQGAPFSLEMETRLKRQSWFTQADMSRVVVSPCEVADILEVFLSIDQGSTSRPNFVISRSTVTLVELTWCVKEGDMYAGLEPRQYHLQEYGLFDKACRVDSWTCETIELNGKLASRVPPFLLNCRLPQREPTMFTNRFSRAYGIKITLELRVHKGLSSMVLTTISEVSLAKGLDLPHGSGGMGLPLIQEVLLNSRKVLRIERQLRSRFCSNDISRSTFSAISDIKNTTYLSHHTDAFVVDDNVNSVIIVDVRGWLLDEPRSLLRMEEICDKLSLFGLGQYPRLESRMAAIVCEVLNASKIVSDDTSTHMVGGLFLRTDRGRLKYKFPNGSPSNQSLNRDYSTFKMPKALIVSGLRLDLTLICEFKVPCGYEQIRGDHVVLPGMDVAEFINLELSLPFAQQFGRSCYLDDFLYAIKSVRVILGEKLKSSSPSHHVIRSRSVTLLSKSTNVSFRWSDFKKRSSSKDEVTMTLAPFIYRCTLPNLGPTFYCDNIFRSYHIRIDLTLQIGGEKSENLFVVQIINVAASDTTCMRTEIPTIEQFHQLPPYEA